LKLSRERAAAVVAALEARGVNANALKSIGVGEAKATVPATASDAERQVDRKVVVSYRRCCLGMLLKNRRSNSSKSS
jgi:outer membrane protein OmpA-like peptidoglycan-associated protein